MKLNTLMRLPPLGILAHFGQIQRIAPRYGTDIIYECDRYGTTISGILRWNGAIMFYECIGNENYLFGNSSVARQINKKIMNTGNNPRNYYVVYVRNDNSTLESLRANFLFSKMVSPVGNLRRAHTRPPNINQDTSDKWYKKIWSATPLEDFDYEVVAWFSLES